MKPRHTSVPGAVRKEDSIGGLSAVRRTQLHDGSARGRIDKLESSMWRGAAAINRCSWISTSTHRRSAAAAHRLSEQARRHEGGLVAHEVIAGPGDLVRQGF